MEAAKEGVTIRAPRLEDAGLEDCALSPNSIKQAFFKAANSIKSFVAHDEQHQTLDSKGCVQDSIGGGAAADNGEGNKGSDRVVDTEVLGNDKEACVDGLKGLKINNGGNVKDGDKKEKGPILVEGFI
ncbi:hypothetical protein ACHQM5_002211 [Ranunculus cassubicifolius]